LRIEQRADNPTKQRRMRRANCSQTLNWAKLDGAKEQQLVTLQARVHGPMEKQSRNG
jgi:hypothetical protein